MLDNYFGRCDTVKMSTNNVKHELDNKFYFYGLIGLLTASLLILIGQSLHVVAGSVNSGPRDGFVQLIPWVLTTVLLAVGLGFGKKFRLGLVSTATVILLHLAMPYLLRLQPGLDYYSHTVWIDTTYPDTEWINGIADKSNTLISVGDWLIYLGTFAVIFSVASVFFGLKSVILSRPPKASFSIDMMLLVVIFFGSVVWSINNAFEIDYLQASNFSLGIWELLWLLPLMIWLAFTCRQGGVIAIGSATGLVTTFLVIPFLMNLIVSVFLGGSSATTVFADGELSSYNSDAYNVLNPFGSMTAVSIVSVGILLIALWWSYGNFSKADPAKSLATTSSSINSLSVVAFLLAWIPLTAIPANVIGHMAYDQVVDGKEPQRGIGLSRWAIILSYISLTAGAIAIFSIWFD